MPVRFKVMSYALLGDTFFNMQADHLSQTDPCRDPRYRRRRILAEIEGSNSDIVCLQEVTNYSEQNNYFIKKLESFGYKIVSSSSEQVQEQSKQERLRYFDLMIAYCNKEFTLIDKLDVDFYKVKYQYSRCQEDFKKTNKGLLCLFEHKASQKRIVVGNMQLYHGFNHDYVR
jgi:mRNA deadenylase 3'-5' endonuclease subunit Ccr4